MTAAPAPATAPRPGAYALTPGQAGRTHHETIAQLWDQYTKPRISGLFTSPDGLRGANVLEIGAGCGSIAVWLADQVGPDGQVCALDLDPSMVPDHPRLRKVRADLNVDPLPDGLFHLIHARQVLPHVHTRDTILPALARRLAPGGWLLLEDLYRAGEGLVIDSPEDLAERIRRVQGAVGQVFAQAGQDRTWVERVPVLMRAAALAHVHTTMHGETWTSGPHSIGAAFLTGLIDQMRPRLLDRGVTEQDLAVVQSALLRDDGSDQERPQVLLKGHTLWSTAGRAPGAGPA